VHGYFLTGWEARRNVVGGARTVRAVRAVSERHATVTRCGVYSKSARRHAGRVGARLRCYDLDIPLLEQPDFPFKYQQLLCTRIGMYRLHPEQGEGGSRSGCEEDASSLVLSLNRGEKLPRSEKATIHSLCLSGT